ncbi:hypothetical protein DL96DRAFT_897817 [Flagelloscypha sp. PMI_526]|nr:hypothetical protein DL96DRAFT_897817 [Flagelloscypha sp. PMI_526]
MRTNIKKKAAKPGANKLPNKDTPNEKEKKTRAPPLLWDKNPDWTLWAIEYLTNNVPFRLKMFSDSTQAARAENRARVQGKDGRDVMFGHLAEPVFTHPTFVETEPQLAKEYKENPKRFVQSIKQRFARLRDDYRKHAVKLKATGGGVLPEDQQTNIIEQIKEEFPFWDDLHAFWRELPNYSPIAVSSSERDIDHASRAASLFNTDKSKVGDLEEEELQELELDPEAEEDEDSGTGVQFSGDREGDVDFDFEREREDERVKASEVNHSQRR